MSLQFDICPLRRPKSRITHVVVLQHNVLGDISTVLAAPLRIEVAATVHHRLRPQIRTSLGVFFLAVEQMAVIERKDLGPAIGTAEECADAIKRALDVAFYGL